VNIPLKALYYETIDIVLKELESRFSNNGPLYAAVHSISNKSTNFLELEVLQPLQQLALKMPCKEELMVGKNCLHRMSTGNKEDEILLAAFEHRMAFPDLYGLIASVSTFGCSTAMCESSFSTLSRIDRPNRRSMLHDRMSNLVMLSFEWKRTNSINMADFLKKFASKKTRRLQLF
jgi:hypothetical protein